MAKFCSVVMLDDTKRQFPISSKLMGSELFSMVASQYGLHEKEYFGLSYTASSGDQDRLYDYQDWLDLTKTVKEQFPKSKQLPLLTFAVRFYVSDVRYLKELATQRLFFQHALRLVSSGRVECESERAMTLAALALQITQGDFIDESATRHHLDAKKLISDEALVAEGSSLEACARKVSSSYQTLIGMDQGSAILSFMTLVQALPQYGIHYFNVKDNKGVPWALGIHNEGINEYLFSDQVNARRTGSWSDVINISVSKNKFLVELETAKHARPHSVTTQQQSNLDSQERSSSRWSRKRRSKSSSTGLKTNDVRDVRVWTTPSADYAKTLLNGAVEQHKYHLRASKEQSRALFAPQLQRGGSGSLDTSNTPTSPTSTAEPAQMQVRAPSSSGIQELLTTTVDRRRGSSLAPQSILETTREESEETKSEGHVELERLLKRQKQLQHELARQVRQLNKLEQEERDWLAAARTQSQQPAEEEMSPRRSRRASTIASALSPLTENELSGLFNSLGGIVETDLVFHDDDEPDVLPLRLSSESSECLPLRMSISEDPRLVMGALLDEAHVNNTSDFSLRVAAQQSPEPDESPFSRPMPESKQNSLSDLLNDDEMRELVQQINNRVVSDDSENEADEEVSEQCDREDSNEAADRGVAGEEAADAPRAEALETSEDDDVDFEVFLPDESPAKAKAIGRQEVLASETAI
eukprot:m.107327 g.107327  ORF g.107327 m.107327 type:complete len:699 (+) comp15313_c0_seq1:189-2285(+)